MGRVRFHAIRASRFRLAVAGTATLVVVLTLLVPATLFANLALADTPTPVKESFPHAGPPAEKRYAELVTTLADPSTEGRGPGTDGIVKARDWLAGQFAAAGLTPACDSRKSYLQPFDIRAGVKVGEQAISATDAGGKPAALDAKREFVAMGFSASGAFEGEAVFVGYGITDAARKYDSYGGAAGAVKGKVAIVYRYEPMDGQKSQWAGAGAYGGWSPAAGLMEKARAAAAHGAVAMIVVNPPTMASAQMHSTASSSFGVQAGIPIFQGSPGLLRRLLTLSGDKAFDETMKAWQAAADAGTGKLVPLGVKLAGKVSLEPVVVPGHNVIGVLPGAGPLGRQAVIVGAHYDHVGFGGYGSRDKSGKVHPGADDNASGTAGVVMLAHWFGGRLADAESAPANRRTLVFAAFSGEELGLIGSRHLAGRLDQIGLKPSDVTLMLNLDMIGRMRKDKVDVWGTGSAEGLKAIVAEALKSSGLNASMASSGVGPSDQASFYRVKIPVLSFFTGGHADYHTPADTADKINAEGAVRILTVAETVLNRLWTEPVELAYKAPPKGPMGAMGEVVLGDAVLGVLPDYAAEKGCIVGELSPGGPAEKAGIEGGDEIVAFDGREISSVEELLVALHACKPGQEVTVKVRRDGKTMEIKVTLGKR